MTWDGTVVDDNPVGWSEQDAQTSDVTVTSTTNATLPGLSVTISSPSTDAVYMADLDPDVTTTANTLNFVELLVDGTAQTPQIITQSTATGNLRVTAHKRFRITGLTGTHTITARTRNSGASTSATVRAANTLLTVERIA